MGRVNQHWRKVLPIWSLPVDSDRQMTATGWNLLRESLYQIQQTEETAARLLGSVAKELFS